MALNQPGINQRDFQEGVSLAGYRKTRKTLGTVNYTPYRYSNLYEPISRKIQKDLEFFREQKTIHKASKRKSSEKKRIGITEKKNLMEDILVPSNMFAKPKQSVQSGSPKEHKDKNSKQDTIEPPKETKETIETKETNIDDFPSDQSGGKLSSKKIIRVSNISPEKKKEPLVL
uniref:Uncharacterized protein n=1 Tax=viral metagenome TaxID=1070528 RepID=A0A6C0F698_9ZZZZ|tara:strand:+ start:2320 stop:2838 length:519 start_codon:yes stop_codon:yes gene_type:complete